MAMWRIRINLADDPLSRERLDQVLASQRVQAIRLSAREDGSAALAGEVVLELPRDDALGDMLAALHTISSQVYVSRADTRSDAVSAPARQPEALLASS